MLYSFCFLLFIPPAQGATVLCAPVAEAGQIAAKIDDLVARHWQANKVKPAALVDDAAFLRRLTLDLAGRIPTHAEAAGFVQDRAPDKRLQAVRRLLTSPEYSLNMGRVLDEMIQGKFAGAPEFLEYLRAALAQHKPWDQIFRDVMLGPWDARDRKGAEAFLTRRLKSLDDLTTDTARVFFGVNVSCAKCHNHPLAPDWTQDHYYGMASFFAATYEGNKGKKKGGIDEKAASEVMFVTTKGERRTAKMMFLSNRVLDEPAARTATGKPQATDHGALISGNPKKQAKEPPWSSRRELLVRTALEEKAFFSRAIANRLWAYFIGRGLVQPVDQMHSANPPAIPGVLEWLGDDLAAHGYNIDRLVAGLVLSREYQLASVPMAGNEEPGERDFAVAQLRALTPQQLANSFALATGDGTFEQANVAAARGRRYRDLEAQTAGLVKLDLLDPRTDHFQSSMGEALFMSNGPDIQRHLAPSGKNLVARLAAMTDTGRLIDTAVWTILSRAPEAEERAYLMRWVDEHKQTRARACGELAWALLTSAEFRFNH